MFIWGIPTLLISSVLTIIGMIMVLVSYKEKFKELIASKTITQKQLPILAILLLATVVIICNLFQISLIRFPLKPTPLTEEAKSAYRAIAMDAVRSYDLPNSELFAEGFVEQLNTLNLPHMRLEQLKPFLSLFLEQHIRAYRLDASCEAGKYAAVQLVNTQLHGKTASVKYSKEKIQEEIQLLQSLKKAVGDLYQNSMGKKENEKSRNDYQKALNPLIDNEIFSLLDPFDSRSILSLSPDVVDDIVYKVSSLCSAVSASIETNKPIAWTYASFFSESNQSPPFSQPDSNPVTLEEWRIKAPRIFTNYFNNRIKRDYISSEETIYKNKDLSQFFTLSNKLDKIFDKKHEVQYSDKYHLCYLDNTMDYQFKGKRKKNGIIIMGVVDKMLENPDAYDSAIREYTHKWELREKAKKVAHQELLAKSTVSVEEIRDAHQPLPFPNTLKNEMTLYSKAVQAVVENKMKPEEAVAAILEVTNPDPYLLIALKKADQAYLEKFRQRIPSSPDDLSKITNQKNAEQIAIVKSLYPDTFKNQRDSLWWYRYNEIIRTYIRDHIASQRPEFMDLKPEDMRDDQNLPIDMTL